MEPVTDLLIEVDPGHGGKDSGVVVAGLRECDSNLLAARALQAELLRYEGVDVQLTHQGNPVGLQGAQRATMANSASADLLISLHADSAAKGSPRGHHVIYSLNGDRRLAQSISDCLATATDQPAFRAPWTKALQAYPDQDWYAIIRNARMPALIVERGFMTNAEDAALLFDSDHLATQAVGIAAGIAAYFGLRRVGDVFKDVPPGSTYYRAVKAAYEAGLVAGYPDGTLGAKEQITTERMVALLHRLYIKVRSDVMTAADARVQALISRCKPATVMLTSTKVSGAPSLGTGFVIRHDGYIATNEHVVKDKDGEFTGLQVWVMTDGNGFEQAKAYPARVVATNNWDDVALLKIEASGLPVLPVTTREPLEGETVVAIGNPRGYQYVSSKGIVAQDTASLGGMIDGRFQTDAAINAGNSGGPVISMAGEVLGIAEASVVDSDNLSFAVKSIRLKDLVDKHLPGLIN